MRGALERHAEVWGCSFDEEFWSKIEILNQLWGRYGPNLGLTAARGPELTNQVLAGLQALACAGLPAGRPWLDVGSGAGFTALCAAAVGWRVDLIEPRQRRAAFLELALGSISARKSRVVRGRIERSTWNSIGSNGQLNTLSRGYDIASARSVMEPEIWLKSGASWVGDSGLVLVHLRPSDPDPRGGVVVRRVDSSAWSVRAVRPD